MGALLIGVRPPANYVYGGKTVHGRVDNPKEVKASFNAGGVSLESLQAQRENAGADVGPPRRLAVYAWSVERR